MGQACDTRYDPVQGQRGGYTVVTSVWADGTRGPMFINVVAGKYNQEKINEFNARHIGRCYINVSEVDTHFMTAESTLVIVRAPLCGCIQVATLEIQAHC